MSRLRPNLLLSLAALILAAPSVRATEAEPAAPAPAEATSVHEEILPEPETTPTAVVTPKPSPTLLQEVRDAKQAHQTRLAELTAAFARETDPERAMEIQRRIQTEKWNVQLEFLEIQARHAQLVGMDDVATEAQQVIANMKASATVAPTDEVQGEGSK